MNVSELVDEAREILDDRDQTGFDQSDMLVSDTRLVRLLNEAQDQFCFLSGYLRTTMPMALKANVQVYTIPAYVIRILHIRTQHFKMGAWTDNSQYLFMPDEHRATIAYPQYTTGEPFAYITDEDGNHQIRFIATPSVAETATMRVWRRPKTKLTTDGTDVPEIPEPYHQALVEYAVWRVYSGHDVDIGEDKSASIHKKNFDAWVRQARRELRAFENRTVRFNVGSSGFSYHNYWEW